MILAAAASAGPSTFVVITWIIGAVLSISGLVMGVLGYTKSNQRAEKTDLVLLEKRLVTLEEKTRSSPDISDRLTSLEGKVASNPQVLERITALESKAALNPQLIDKLNSVVERLVAVETKIDVFWKGIAIDAAKMLHQPHPEFARRDTLLEKFTFDELTREEAQELANALMPVYNSSTKIAERIAAGILLRTLRIDFNLPIDIPLTIGHPDAS